MTTFLFHRYGSHYKALLQLGVPIVVGNIGQVVLSFADTLMIGWHSMRELAAAAFVNTMFLLLVIFALGFSMGLSPIVGRHFGRGEHGSIGRVLRAALVANLLLAVLLLAVTALLYVNLHRLGQPAELLPLMKPYLLVNMLSIPFACVTNVFKQFFEAIGRTKVSMVVMVCGNVTNIVGNALLIYGLCGMPEWGLLGAGVSTALSRVLMMTGFVLVFAFGSSYRTYRRDMLAMRTDAALFRQLNVLGWPSAVQVGIETAAFTLTSVFVGWIGTQALAAHQIMITMSGLFYMVYLGIASAVLVRVSHFNGQHDWKAIVDTSKAGFHIILVMASTVAVPVFLLRHQVGGWFTSDAQVGELVAVTIIPLILYQFGDGLQCTYANALRGLACMKPLMRASIVAYIGVSIPLSWLLGIVFGGGLLGVWSAFPVCLFVAGILYLRIFRRLVAEGKQR